ncbi:PREDICTED: uncharacterized protein At1g15400-like [Tarenaya hassleriana]|uniref:uncharacterized protein At1g15400-like n=1 Tax=Tarenaya hassleriana TaxID=28532 RepID=UPI00053C7405|nr:PREDICTED: uncharacterized protein At1g15400-like [Tarenaya hassleriana]
MAGLQRSTISFRRQGSSGIVWDDRFLSGELNQPASDQKDESQRDEQAKPMSEGQEQGKPITDDAKDGIKPIRTVGSAGTIERSRSNGGGAVRAHRSAGRVSPALDPPSPRLSACGCCSVLGKKPPGKKSNPRKRPAKRRSM